MTGPSIVVPPAMPQRSFPPRVPHSTSNTGRSSHQGAKNVKGLGLNADANTTKTASAAAPGRKERVCSTSSCTNVLERGWPWKRCRQCKAREVRKAANPRVCVDVSCVACFTASAVPVNELKAGQLYLCGPCRERSTALATALMQPPTLNPSHPLVSPRTIIMHDASPLPKHDARSLGHGSPPVSQAPSPNQSMFVPTPPPPPQAQFVPMPITSDASTSTASGSSPFDAIMRFVHPDHRHILGQRGVLVPPPPSQIAPAPAPASQHTVAPDPPTTPPAVKRVRLNMPHYSRTGAILAVLPEDLGMKRASLPPAKASAPPPTPTRTAETENIAGSSSASLTQSEPYPLETPRKVSVTHAQNGSIKLKIPPKQTPPPIAPAPIPIPTPSDKSPHANAVASSSSLAPAPQRKKRKRPQKAAVRICDSPGCENAIPPRFKGARCVQCGFARWSTVFRERFDGIRAELIQAGIAGPAEAVKEKADGGPGREVQTLTPIEKQPAPGDAPSSATVPGRERAPSAAQDGVSPRASSVLHAGIPPPSVFRKPSIKSVKLIVSPRHTEPIDSANSSDQRPSPARTGIPPSEAPDVPRPKIKSIKLRVSAPPDSHTPSIDTPATHTDDTPQLTPAIHANMDVVEAERTYPMDIDHDQAASDRDTTDTEASIPLAYRSAETDTKTTPQHSVSDAAEAEAEYPTYFDHDLEDHTGDTTESEMSVPLADWTPSLIPSTTPHSSSSLPPVRRVRLVLGPNPVRAPSSSRESSPELALSSSRPFSVRRRWEELGWDTDESDLTPLEESTDEGESEIDLPESSDEEGEGDGGAETGARLSIVIPRRTEKPPEKHRWQCATAQCANVLAYGSFFKKCDACRKRIHLRRKQEATRDRLEDAAPSRYADSEFHIPPDADLTGYRKCGHARCNHLIPPASQYRYRTCGPCRALRRRRWWKQKGLEPPPEDAPVRKKTSASIMERAIANAVRTAAKEEAPATGKRKRQAADDTWEEVPSLMEMPPYQHFAALLDALRARFSQFKAVQTRYVQLKALTGSDSKPMVFNFDGEYSVVTDPSGGSVDAVVNTVIRNVQAALDLRFQPTSVNSGPEDSVIASLSGAYIAQIPRLSNKPVMNTTDSESAMLTDISAQAGSGACPPLEVTMAGELHICVAWDRRHKFFPGQRVMLRFRLVG